MSKADVHGSSPPYRRHRRNAEAVVARAEKKEERLARKRQPKAPKPETAAERLARRAREILTIRKGKKQWTPGQERHHLELIERAMQRAPIVSGPTKRRVSRQQRRARARRAAASRARNRR